jgi:hypothetical protein
MTDEVFEQGDTLTLEITFTDGITGAAVSATGVTCSARAVGSPSAVNITGIQSLGGGLFRVDWLPPSPGRWAVRWACTGPKAAAKEQRFSVGQSAVLNEWQGP